MLAATRSHDGCAEVGEVGLAVTMLRLADLESARRAGRRGVLDDIDDYDEAHAASYGQTLRVYLASFGDPTEASKALGVHTNTLRYRLRRLHELFGLDVADADTRFALMVDIRLRTAATPDQPARRPEPAGGDGSRERGVGQRPGPEQLGARLGERRRHLNAVAALADEAEQRGLVGVRADHGQPVRRERPQPGPARPHAAQRQRRHRIDPFQGQGHVERVRPDVPRRHLGLIPRRHQQCARLGFEVPGLREVRHDRPVRLDGPSRAGDDYRAPPR